MRERCLLIACALLACGSLAGQAQSQAERAGEGSRASQAPAAKRSATASATSARAASQPSLPRDIPVLSPAACIAIGPFSPNCELDSDQWYAVDRVSGRVVLPGGQSPPGGAVVNLDCVGETKSLGFTGATGRFAFAPAKDPTLLEAVRGASASAPTQNIRVSVDSGVEVLPCSLSAKLAGHVSEFVPSGFRLWASQTMIAAVSRLHVGTIVIRPGESAPGFVPSVRTASAPPEARRAYDSGLRAYRRRDANLKQAEGRLAKAVEAYPGFAAAWHTLGEVRWERGNAGGAMQAFIRSINADERYLPPYEMLVRMETADRNWEEVEWLTERYLEVSPNAPAMLFASAVAAVSLGNLELAQARLDVMAQLDELDQWPKSYIVGGLAYEGRLDYRQASRSYQKYLQLSKDRAMAEVINRHLWEWKRLGVLELPVADPEDAANP